MRRISLLILLVLCWLPAQAEDENKASLIQLIQVGHNSPVEAMILQKHATFVLSPAAWTYINDPAQKDARNQIRTLGSMLNTVAANMKWGDAIELDRKQGNDGKSPLTAEMVDSWSGKLALTLNIELTSPDELAKAFANVGYLYQPTTNDYFFHPRGGKALLNVRLDRKAAKVDCKVSRDGNTYQVTLPVHGRVSQMELQDAYSGGRAPR